MPMRESANRSGATRRGRQARVLENRGAWPAMRGLVMGRSGRQVPTLSSALTFAMLLTIAFVFTSHRVALSAEAVAAETGTIGEARVEEAIERILDGASLGSARIAVYAKDLDTGEILSDHEGEALLIPASNMKLITTGAALLTLGPEFTFQTRLLRDARGRIILEGSGDPGLGDPDLLREMGITVEDLVDIWADDLLEAGVTHIPEFILDDRIFDDVFHHPDWMAEDLIRGYGAQIAGFNFFGNVVNFYFRPASAAGAAPTWRVEPDVSDWIQVVNRATTRRRGEGKANNALWLDRRQGSNVFIVSGKIRRPAETIITIHDPAETFGPFIAQRFRAKGIRVDAVRSAEAHDRFEGPEAIGHVIQTAMPTLLTQSNTDSENRYAEALLKRMGHQATGRAGSWANGASVLRHVLSRRLGPGLATQAVVSDGSGLSRKNRLTARLLVEWLDHLHQQDEAIAERFRESLALGGSNGTLRKRFGEVDLEGVVRAKSGYMRGISCLSGYVMSDAGRTAAFSVLVNDIPPRVPTAKAKAVQERVVEAIDQYLESTDAILVTTPAGGGEDPESKFGG